LHELILRVEDAKEVFSGGLTMRRTALSSFYSWLFIGGLVLIAAGLTVSPLFAAMPSTGIQPSAGEVSGTQQINGSELENLLKTLEDPVERERLITQLRRLLEIQNKINKPERKPDFSPPGPEARVSTPYEKLSQWAENLPERVAKYVQALPGFASQLKQHLSKKENLVSLAKNASIVFLTLLLALWLRHHLLRRLRNLIKRTRPPEAHTWWRKVSYGAADLGAEFLSVLVLFIVVAVISGLIGWANKLSILLIVLVAILSLYWLALSLVQKLASPEEPVFRLLPCGDQMAEYILIWARRLLLYGLFAYAPLWFLEWAGWKGDVIKGLTMVYRFGWIALVGVLLFQLKDRLSPKIPHVREGKTLYTRIMTTNINWILPRLYPILALFLLFILFVGAIGYTDKASFLLMRTGLSLLIIAFGVGIWAILSFLLGKLFAIGDLVKARFPGLDVMANRYIIFLNFFIKGALTIFVAVLVFQAWGLDLFALITRGFVAKLLGRLLVVGITIGISFSVIQVTQILVARLLADKTDNQGQVISMGRRGKTFIPLLNNLVRYITFFIAGVIILEQLGINTGPILAGAGIVGLAVGFGAQTLVKDILTGCFIILEDSISVGDVVMAKGTGGLVEAVNLRTIKLRDLAGNVHVIPNSSIETITNMTKEYSRYVLDVGVAYREDVDEVIQVLKEIDEEMRKDPAYGPDILQPLEILGVEEFAASQVTIRTRITTKPIKQWGVAREMRRRIKRRFDELEIEIPFPHTTLYIGNPKREAPQPLVIQLQREAE
jgi:small-conductance mechanosensitive channel